MKTSKPVLVVIALACFGLLGGGMYVQFILNMLPCPLCILQRYAFVAIALLCLITAALPRGATRGGAFLGLLAALSGLGIAIRLLWIQAHPGFSCGIDPVETALNKIPTAQLMPFLFKALGECSTEYGNLFGLSVPQWSLAWFVAFTVVLGWVVFKRKR